MIPPCRLGENAPAWLCPSATSFISSRIAEKPEPAPEVLAAREARAAKQHAEALARQAARDAERVERMRRNAESRAETKRLRAEIAQRNKAEAAAKKAEERRKAQAARIAARIATKATKPKPPKRPTGGNLAPVAPAGCIGMAEAARRVGRSRTCLHAAAQEGRLHVIKQGRYLYVRMEDVAAYLKEAQEGQRANQERNLSKARANRIARAKLCSRKRGAA